MVDAGPRKRGVDREVLKEVLRRAVAESGQPSFTSIARKIAQHAHRCRADEQVRARTLNGPKVRRLVRQLRASHPWFDEALDYYGVGLKPRSHWWVIVSYAYIRHGNQEDAGRELGIKPNSVMQVLRRFQRENPRMNLKGMMALAKVDRAIRLEYLNEDRDAEAIRRTNRATQAWMNRDQRSSPKRK